MNIKFNLSILLLVFYMSESTLVFSGKIIETCTFEFGDEIYIKNNIPKEVFEVDLDGNKLYKINELQENDFLKELQDWNAQQESDNKIYYDDILSLRFNRFNDKNNNGIFRLKESEFSTNENYFDLCEKFYTENKVQKWKMDSTVNVLKKKSYEQSEFECGQLAVLNGFIEVCGCSSNDIENYPDLINELKILLQNNDSLMSGRDYNDNIENISDMAILHLINQLSSGEFDMSSYLNNSDVLKDKNIEFVCISNPNTTLADSDKITDKVKEAFDKFQESEDMTVVFFVSFAGLGKIGHWETVVAKKEDGKCSVVILDSKNKKLYIKNFEAIFAKLFGTLEEIEQDMPDIGVTILLQKNIYVENVKNVSVKISDTFVNKIISLLSLDKIITEEDIKKIDF